jgi:beta-galactosidase
MDFNHSWSFYSVGQEANKRIVDLPHDAMLYEGRDETNPGGTNISFFKGGKYIYEKEFTLDDIDDSNSVYFEFEGVYQNTKVFINNELAYQREYGYTDFIFDATKYCKFHQINQIRVEVDNSLQPNSRWYSGSGIYRPVHIFIKKETHVLPESLQVKTLDYQTGVVEITASLSKPSSAALIIQDMSNHIVFSKNYPSSMDLKEKIQIPELNNWSINNPYLYTCVLKTKEDQEERTFGVRQVELDTEKGFLINGERVIIYGCCIHHDNGLLGAAAYSYSEERKVALLKKAGYNALRLAHNPSSQALLNACDKLGMLVMDEYVDCWYIHKTPYDYAGKVENNYQEDLKDLVRKDFSHPSVVLYSTGNEVSETASHKGAQFTLMLTNYLHSLDDTRPVTCGVNIFFNALCALGFGVYSDKKAKKNATSKKKKSVGSEFFNKVAGLLGAGFMKFGASLPICDRKTKESFANMDVAGYNYGIKRYKHDLKKYPKRFILGSETFCSDAAAFYSLAKSNNRLIGDFVWSGMDYLGESGIGSWVNKKIYQNDDLKSHWLTAGSGRLDILGDENSEMSYTRVAFNQERIAMGVVSPFDYKEGHSPSAWKLSWALNSYSFEGAEGLKTIVEVYCKDYQVGLYQNGKLLIKKKPNKDGRCCFKIKYWPGTLEAVSYSKDNKETGKCSLVSSSKETKVALIPETQSIPVKDGLAYIHVYIKDNNGTIKSTSDTEVDITKIDNGKLLGFGNACPYNPDGYLNTKTSTYYGKALMIIKPLAKGPIQVTVKSKYGNESVLMVAK